MFLDNIFWWKIKILNLMVFVLKQDKRSTSLAVQVSNRADLMHYFFAKNYMSYRVKFARMTFKVFLNI